MKNSLSNLLCRAATAGLVLLASAVAVTLPMARPAAAEAVLSFYLGANASPDSVVDYDFNLGGGPQSTSVAWDGETFKMPPYFGMRATWWLDQHPNWGLAIDNVHAKIAAGPLPAGFTTLEFTDGVNMLTGNLHYRHLNDSPFTPYAGIGIGITMPHVEVTNTAGTSDTSRYQFGGPAAQVLFGLEHRVNDRWSVFGEVKFAKFWIDADLDGGGSVSTDILSRQIAFGVNYTFNRR
ncbi:MAG: porin family protein [Rhodobacteraceae bacterium]|nr:porin family protein [Paracoccaceae bacterium]